MAPPLLTFDASCMRAFMTDIFKAGGWGDSHAQTAATHLVASDQAGHASHGIGLIPMYVQTLKAGHLSPACTPRTLKDDGTFLVVDAARSLGQVAALETTQRAVEIARRHGVAIANLLNSHHIGRIGHYGEIVAAAGFVGLFWVNVHGRKPTVVPFGAREPRFSTNPHCVAIPRLGSHPFLLDFSTAEIAVNKARVAAAQGKKVRPGMLVDADGKPTDDPGVIFREPRGSIAAFGQHKGSGLALACELLSSVLGGGPMVADEVESGAILNNMTAIVIDPARMATSEEPVDAATERLIGYVKSAATAEGCSEVLTPGDPEQTSRDRLGTSVEIDANTWAEIETAARAMGVMADKVPRQLSSPAREIG